MTEIDKYGRIKNRNFQPQSVSRFPSFNGNNENLWQQLNRFVANIGEWLEYNMDSICTNISIGIYILCWIIFAVLVIVTWINEGFLIAVISGIILGVIVYYGSAFLLYINILVLHILFRILRFLFYNIYTLLCSIVAVVSLYLHHVYSQ